MCIYSNKAARPVKLETDLFNITSWLNTIQHYTINFNRFW